MNPLIEKSIQCPYCWEIIDILVDPSASFQDYIEDCQVCCRPIRFVVTIDADSDVSVEMLREDD